MSAGAVGGGRARNVKLGRIACHDLIMLEFLSLFLWFSSSLIFNYQFEVEV
jgi:hypothetical protein